MIPKLRMALCIYGQPRTMEFCAPSVKEHLLDVYHPDVFICSDEQGDKMKELYNPVAIEIHADSEIWKSIGDRRNWYGFTHPSPGWPQFQIKPSLVLNFMFKGWRCGEMLRAYEAEHGQYDVVVTTRPDIKFLYIQPITMPEEKSLYIPRVDAHQWPIDESGLHWKLGYSTHTWWSSSVIASSIFDSYNWSDQYFRETGVWCGEMMIKWFCDKSNIKVQYTDVTQMIIKGDKDNPRSNSIAFGKLLSAFHYPEYLSPPLSKELHIPVPLPTYGGDPGHYYPPIHIPQVFPHHARREVRALRRINRREKKI